MTDPATSVFWASWQDDGVLDDVELQGAEAAIAWGRERANAVLIRLGHTEQTYFSAGDGPASEMPPWPPQGAPVEGWWSPTDAPPSPADETSAAAEWLVELGLKFPALNEAARQAFASSIVCDPRFQNVDEISRPSTDSVEVRGIIIASGRGEAEEIAGDILKAARSAAGRETPNWPRTGTWSWCRVVTAPRP